MSRRAKTKVFLNVYDLSPYNKHLHGFGLGAYHTGIEINGTGMLRSVYRDYVGPISVDMLPIAIS